MSLPIHEICVSHSQFDKYQATKRILDQNFVNFPVEMKDLIISYLLSPLVCCPSNSILSGRVVPLTRTSDYQGNEGGPYYTVPSNKGLGVISLRTHRFSLMWRLFVVVNAKVLFKEGVFYRYVDWRMAQTAEIEVYRRGKSIIKNPLISKEKYQRMILKNQCFVFDSAKEHILIACSLDRGKYFSLTCFNLVTLASVTSIIPNESERAKVIHLDHSNGKFFLVLSDVVFIFENDWKVKDTRRESPAEEIIKATSNKDVLVTLRRQNKSFIKIDSIPDLHPLFVIDYEAFHHFNNFALTPLSFGFALFQKSNGEATWRLDIASIDGNQFEWSASFHFTQKPLFAQFIDFALVHYVCKPERSVVIYDFNGPTTFLTPARKKCTIL